MNLQPVQFRKAQTADIDRIIELLVPFVVQKIVLPRSAADILACLDNFVVATRDGKLIGTVALRDFGDGLQEIRSLAVNEENWGGGLGSQLVSAALELARQRQAVRVFALTMRPALFERLGFRRVGMSMFPQKVWLDCSKCSKRDRCDEVAMLMEMHES